MDIKKQIEQDFIKALKDKEESLSVLRLMKNAIKNAEIEKGEELTDEEITTVLQKEKKQREEAIEQFEKGKRSDLVEKEKAELEVISKYLPRPPQDEEIKKIILKAISETGTEGPQDMGKVMAKVMPELKSKVDGAKVSEMVKKELGNLGQNG